MATHSAGESRGTVVVVMKPVHGRQRDDMPVDLRAPTLRPFLVHALIRAGGVVDTDELRDQVSQEWLVEDEHMIEPLSTDRADEAFRERVDVRQRDTPSAPPSASTLVTVMPSA